MYFIGVGLAIVGFVQFVHNFAMMQAYGLTGEFGQIYEKEIVKAQLAIALGIAGVFIAIYAACIFRRSRTS